MKRGTGMADKKVCPYCLEEINAEAIKCKHCQSMLGENPKSKMSITNWYLEPWKKYATFSGRARRKEYWTFFLGNLIIAFVIGFMEGFLGWWAHEADSILGLIFNLASLIPTIAVGVRRMHDTGRSGWWLLLPIVNLIFLLTDSQPGINQYGSNPKNMAGQ